MSAGLTFEVGITTSGGDNSRTCRMADHERAKREKRAVMLACASYRPADRCSLSTLLKVMAAKGPLDVRVVRLHTTARRCDPHNLGSRLKGIIDGLAKVFGVDDGDPRIRYLLDQERAKVAGVRVEVGPRAKVLPWPSWTADQWKAMSGLLLGRFIKDERYADWIRPFDVGTHVKMAEECNAMAAALEKP